MTRGPFITFEGGEGSGKSTQIALVAHALKAQGRNVLTTREPGGTPGADAIRTLLLTGTPEKWDAWTEFLLMTASRQDHVTRVITPHCTAGTWVLCDRYVDSSRVYQGTVGGIGLEKVDTISWDLMKLPVPDITFLLDIPTDVGLDRAAQRTMALPASVQQETRYEQKGLAFHQNVRQGFLTLAEAAPYRFVVLDATLDQDVLAGCILEALLRRWGSAS